MGVGGKYVVCVKGVEMITGDVLHLVAERPEGFCFTPGQATEVSIDRDGLRDERRPFSITSLPDSPDIEFMIKIYPEHDGFTRHLLNVQVGDPLILHQVFGNIAYRGEGVFIAGGTGITPFLSILRDLNAKQAIGNNALIFINKRQEDVILKDELETMLGHNLRLVLTREKANGYAYGHLTGDLLKGYVASSGVSSPGVVSSGVASPGGIFYLCGPPPMMVAAERHLHDLGIGREQIVKEGW